MKNTRSPALICLILASAAVVLSCRNPFSSAFVDGGVKLGAQSGTLIVGTAGSAAYSVTTIHVAAGAIGTVGWYSSPAGNASASAPAGIAASVSGVAGDAATLTMTATTAVAAGSYYFKLAEGEVSSSIATLTVNGQVATPRFSVGGGTYSSNQSITIGCATPGASIYYTVTAGSAGTTPTTSSTPYTGAIPVTGDGTTETIEAIAVMGGMRDSTVIAATYVINYSLVSTPSFSLGGGTYNTDQSITISCATPGASIYYTVTAGSAGTTPTTSSTPYTGAIPMAGNGTTQTIEAIAVRSGMTDSTVSTATYVINYSQVSTPSFSAGGGAYTVDQSLTISCTTSGATIYYTVTSGTTGTTPTISSSPYAGAIPVVGPGTTQTIEAIAVKSGMSDSSVITATYVVDELAPTVTMLSIAGGATYTSSATVTVSFNVQDNLSGVAGYYVGESSTAPALSSFTSVSNTGTAATPESVSYSLSAGDGPKTIYVFAIDAAGNEFAGTSGTIVLNANGPVVTGATVKDNTAGVASGYCTSGTVTTDAVTATPVSGTTVTAYAITATSASSAPVASDGSWSATPTYALPAGDGTQTVRVWAKDSLGVESSTHYDATIVQDLSGPVVTAATVQDNTGGSLTFCTSGTVTTSSSSVTATPVSGTTVAAYAITATSASSAPVASSGSWSATPTYALPAGDGTQTVRVWAKDSLGIVSSTYHDTTIVQDLNGPSVTAAAVKDNTGGSLTFCTSGTVTTSSSSVTATPVSGTTVAAYAITATSASSAPVASSGSWSATPTYVLPAGDGTQTVRVWAKDSAGMVSTSHIDATIVQDLNGPVVTAATVQDNTGGSLTFCTSGTVTTSSSSVTATPVSGTTVAAYAITATSASTAPIASSGSWSATPTYNLPSGDGSQTLRVWAKDSLQVVSSTHYDATIVQDRNGPVVTGATIKDNTAGVTSGYCTSGTVTTSSSNVTAASVSGTTVAAYVITATSASSAPVASDGSWSATPTYALPAGDGAQTARLWAKDSLGVVSSTHYDATIIQDRNGPVVTGATIMDVATTSLSNCTSGTVATNAGLVMTTPVSGATIAAYAITATSESMAPVASDGSWSATPTYNLPGGDGQYSVRVWAKDSLGVVSSTHYDATIVQDLNGPNVTNATIKDNTPGVTSGYCTSGTVTTDLVSTMPVSGTTVTAYAITATSASSAPVASDGSWSATPTYALPAGDGSQTVRVWAKDSGGAVSSTHYDATIVQDRNGPSVTGASIKDNTAGVASGYCTSGTVTTNAVTATPVSGTTVTSYAITATSASSAPVASDGSWSATPTYALPAGDGSQTVRVWAKDSLGVVSSTHYDATIVQDRNGPTMINVTIRDLTTQDPNYCTSGVLRPLQIDYIPVSGTTISAFAITATSASSAPAAGDASWLSISTTYNLPSGDGPQTVRVWAKDSAGAVSSTHYDATIVQDRNGPGMTSATATLSDSINTGVAVGYCTSGTVTASVSGATLVSGTTVAAYALTSTSTSTAPVASDESWSATPTYALPAGDGPQTVRVWAKDSAGAVSSTYCDATIIQDRNGPVVTGATLMDAMTMSTGNFTSGVVTTNAVTTTPVSGTMVTAYAITNNSVWMAPPASDGSWSPMPNYNLPGGEGQYPLRVWAKDSVGVVSSTYFDATITVDLTPPDIAIAGTNKPTYDGTDLSMYVINEVSGVATITYWYGDIGKNIAPQIWDVPLAPPVSIGSLTVPLDPAYITNVDGSQFSFCVTDAAGNTTSDRYVMYRSSGVWQFDYSVGINYSVISRTHPKPRIGPTSVNKASGSSRASFATAIYDEPDPAPRARVVQSLNEAARTDRGVKPIETSYAHPAGERPKARPSIDISGLSLIARSAAAAEAAAKAAGKPSSALVPIRLTMPAGAPSASAPVPRSAPPASTASVGSSSSASGAGSRAGASAPTTVALPSGGGPQVPAKAPIPSPVPPPDIYMDTESNNREEEETEACEDAE